MMKCFIFHHDSQNNKVVTDCQVHHEASTQGSRQCGQIQVTVQTKAHDGKLKIKFRTSSDQAALYRLTGLINTSAMCPGLDLSCLDFSGDLNPLHIDPLEAKKLKLK